MNMKKNSPIKGRLKKLFSISKLFSRCIIIGSLAYMVHVTEKVLALAQTQGENYYSLLAAAGAVFGGELLLLAFKDIAAERLSGAKANKGSDVPDSVEEISEHISLILSDVDCDC